MRCGAAVISRLAADAANAAAASESVKGSLAVSPWRKLAAERFIAMANARPTVQTDPDLRSQMALRLRLTELSHPHQLQ